MSGNVHLKAWVSPDTKARFAALAKSQEVSESALLRRMVEALIGSERTRDEVVTPPEPVPSSGRISVRLAVDDLLTLARAVPEEGDAIGHLRLIFGALPPETLGAHS